MFLKLHLNLDQRWLIDLSADRTPYISQAQSLNVFIPADVHKRDLTSNSLSSMEKRT